MSSILNQIPLSSVADFVWPAIPPASVAAVFGLQYQMQQTENWSPERLLDAQFLQLSHLYNYARKSTSFYRSTHTDIPWVDGQKFDVALWQSLPVLTREQVQQAGADLHSNSASNSHGKTREIHTSGSTGTPVKVLKTAACDLMYVAISLRDHLWHRRDVTQKLAMIRTVADGAADYPQGFRQPDWGVALNSLFRSGECVVLSISASIEQQMDWLQRERPAYLLTFPSVVEGLVAHAQSQNTTLTELRQITTLGETLNPGLQARVSTVLGASLIDTYSSQEVGYMALQCPVSENYHVQSEAVYLEVLDDQNKPCEPGKVGRVVVTPLHNFAMPLIRYELGDYAEVGEPCSCGRHLPTLKRIVGRTRNLLTLPNGQKLWPRLSELLYGDIVRFKQFQIVQKSAHTLEVKLVPLETVSATQEGQLRDLIVSRIGHPFRIEFSYHSHIPRSRNGKYEDFRSEI